MEEVSYLLIKVLSPGFHRYDIINFELERFYIEELLGKLNYRYDEKVIIQIPDEYYLGFDNRSIKYTRNDELTFPMLGENEYLYLIIKDYKYKSYFSFHKYVLCWVGYDINPVHLLNITDNIQAINYGFINNSEILSRLIKDPTKDWSNLYINKIIDGNLRR
jgi:hypothetical protein